MRAIVLFFLTFSTITLKCLSWNVSFLKGKNNSLYNNNFAISLKNLKNNNIFLHTIKKKYISDKKFSLKENNDEENIQPNNKINSNIFRNQYNYIPTKDEVKETLENFKKEKSFYFTEHSILELINIENNIIVLNIEGKFFEDINVVFSEVTRYLLEKYAGILGVNPYNIKSLNIKSDDS
ncbi:hypothetical protein YYG_03223 [Plasmodium vinckei petteri]|uniref:Fam-b protein n=1 Tax=Plasmodium vinckei petteri TaxID=138298 RepID=W7B211_PLAVN|nr:hypothetical protein YYG_03223 [Plasmodium vinckei petteri]CAD2098153.1 conserved Plasmodium protein, unknown function [Plasmodium vinckei petteri]